MDIALRKKPSTTTILIKAVVIIKIDGAIDKIVNTAISCSVTATSWGLSDEPTSILTLGISGAAEASLIQHKNKSRLTPIQSSRCSLVKLHNPYLLRFILSFINEGTLCVNWSKVDSWDAKILSSNGCSID